MDAREVTYRRAGPADAAALAQLHLDVRDEACAGPVAQEVLDERRAHADERVRVWEEITSQQHTPLVAWHDGEPIGFAVAGAARDNDVDTDLELRSLHVRRAWWGTGVGYALFETEVGDRAAYLWVLHSDLRAIGFFERLGFRLDGTEDEHDGGLHVRMLRAGN